MEEWQAGGPSVPEEGPAKEGTATRRTPGAVCKEANGCFMVDPSKAIGLPTELGFWCMEGHKKLVEGPKPSLG